MCVCVSVCKCVRACVCVFINYVLPLWFVLTLLFTCFICWLHMCVMMTVCTGVDRWGAGGTRPPTFQGGGDSIQIVPPLFISEKLRGIQPDSTVLSLKSRYIGLARQ